ncbi:MAG: carbon storage regulator [Armatimonadetes bacterium]|nr:carbon storage regulator [Armatimonadota bacterium]
MKSAVILVSSLSTSSFERGFSKRRLWGARMVGSGRMGRRRAAQTALVLPTHGSTIKLGFDAPEEIMIYREQLHTVKADLNFTEIMKGSDAYEN